MDQLESFLIDEYAIIDEVVRQRATDLAALGFEPAVTTVGGSPKLQRFPIFHFINRRTGMGIDISFFPAREGRNGGFVVLIIKPVNRKLDVKDYLKLHKREDLAKSFTYRDPNTDVRGFAGSFLRMLLELLGTDLKAVIEGKTFQETPINWMDYK